MPLDLARARRRTALAADAVNADRLVEATPMFGPHDPGPAIGDILFDLVVAGVAFAQGKTPTYRKRLAAAYAKLTILQVAAADAARAERPPSKGVR